MGIYKTSGHIEEFKRGAISESLQIEARLSKEQADIVENDVIATMMEWGLITGTPLKAAGFVTGPLIREIACTVLLRRGMRRERNLYTRAGMPVYDALQIDKGTGYGRHNNANVLEIPESAHKHKADRLAKESYLLSLPMSIIQAYQDNKFHIHDLEYLSRRFCYSHDVRYFFYYGFLPDGTGKFISAAGPAKHADVAMDHCIKVLGTSQAHHSGGQGLLHFLTFISPYFEGLEYKQVYQLIQNFVFEMNQQLVARGGQVVFSSVNLTPGVPKVFRDVPIVKAGQVYDGIQAPLRTYGEFEVYVRWAFKAFMEVLLKGDRFGRPFNFPKPEVSISREFTGDGWDKPICDGVAPSYRDLYELAFEASASQGSCYFENHFPDPETNSSVSCYQCCAYKFEKNSSDADFRDTLEFRNGKHFCMGGMQVVSLNMTEIAIEAEHDMQKLIFGLKHYMDLATSLFLVKKQMAIETDHMLDFLTQTPPDPVTGQPGEPYTNIDELVYDIGIVGLNEAVQIFTGKQIHESKDAHKLAVRLVYEMWMYAQDLSKRTGLKIVVSRTPAETTAQKFAVQGIRGPYADAYKSVVKGDLEAALLAPATDKDLPIYVSNGFSPWVGACDETGAPISVMDRVKIEEPMWEAVAGGAIFQVYLGEDRPCGKSLMDFGMRFARETRIRYFTFNPNFTYCYTCRKIEPQLHDHCIHCNSDQVIQMARVTGYMSAVSLWNEGKKEELKARPVTRFG